MADFAAVERSRLEREQLAGRVSPDLDPHHTSRLLDGTVERTISLHCHIAGPDEDAGMAKALARSIWLTVYG